MNLLFWQKRAYLLPLDIDEAQKQISFVCTRRFDDYSMRIIGWIRPDRSFGFADKWGFTRHRWIPNRTAYLSGSLTEEGADTRVSILIKPNVLLVIAFYIFLLAGTAEWFYPEDWIPARKTAKLIGAGALAGLFLGLILYFNRRLRMRFEHHARLQS